jgi:hypothetical protein
MAMGVEITVWCQAVPRRGPTVVPLDYVSLAARRWTGQLHPNIIASPNTRHRNMSIQPLITFKAGQCELTVRGSGIFCPDSRD